MSLRIKNYHNLSNTLTLLSNAQVKNFFEAKENDDKIIKIDNINVFVKKIPIADLFYQNQFETGNLYKLPLFYNFGIGSVGISPWRELALHLKTTNFVLTNQCSSFLLLYHYRIIEDDYDMYSEEYIKSQSKGFHNYKQIKYYLKDRAMSRHKIVLFLEYIPHNLYEYGNFRNEVFKHLDYTKKYYEQAKIIISFLNRKKIYHFDAHTGNFIVDNKGKLYLTDFGLAVDEDFNLTNDERKLLKYNKKYDNQTILFNIYRLFTDQIFYNKLNLDKLNELFKNIKLKNDDKNGICIR